MHKTMNGSFLAAATLGVVLTAGVGAAQVTVDPSLPSYEPVSGVSGNIKSVGSDTMNNEMTLWAEGFRKHYPGVKVEIEGKGSSTAPPSLTEGTSHFGPMSRPMKDQEMDTFEAKYGYKPTAVRTSIDMLALYVNKDNPIECLTLQQLDAMFSTTRRGGQASDVRTWGDVGLTGEWAKQPISLYGRNSASGTYGYFKEMALFKGDFKPSVKEQPGSSSVVQAVATERYAIGYSGIGYMTADVRAVALGRAPGQCFEATADNGYNGTYPLSRFLYTYVNKRPAGQLEPLRAEFLKYVLGRDGQEAVLKSGYLPLPARVVTAERNKLGL